MNMLNPSERFKENIQYRVHRFPGECGEKIIPSCAQRALSFHRFFLTNVVKFEHFYHRKVRKNTNKNIWGSKLKSTSKRGSKFVYLKKLNNLGISESLNKK